MGKVVNIGGDRIGAGGKRKVELEGHGLSTQNLSKEFKTTMACGTLVPFLNMPSLPGDSHEIDLQAYLMTHPTIGPLFDDFDVQLHVFSTPMRLFMPTLQMNIADQGRNMENVLIPQMEITAPAIDWTQKPDNQQINPSSLLAYLGVRGLGQQTNVSQKSVTRRFNAMGLLSYMEICRNYYCNLQEKYGYQISRTPREGINLNFAMREGSDPAVLPINGGGGPVAGEYGTEITDFRFEFHMDSTDGNIDADRIMVLMKVDALDAVTKPFTEYFDNIAYDYDEGMITFNSVKPFYLGKLLLIGDTYYDDAGDVTESQPRLVKFNLSNIDETRKIIYREIFNTSAFTLDRGAYAPYGNLFQGELDETGKYISSTTVNQQGLLVRTYMADLYNNWIRTEFVDGVGGVSDRTKIDVVGGNFTIDQFNFKSKLWKMLNAIDVSGGDYDDYISVVYDVNAGISSNKPAYEGGLHCSLVFNRVVSTAGTSDEPLGTIAGEGNVTNRNGGKVVVKTREYSWITGIVSIVPKINYSQGNAWHGNIKNMSEWHVPDLDEIAFQDLNTDQMAFFDTKIDNMENIFFKSAGKVPAWSNYTTDVNETFGNFASGAPQDWMVNNRNYRGEQGDGITDLTTYIDPMKYNHIFAQTSRDAQNYWVQISMKIKSRRKMSSKVMPKLG